MKGNPREMLFTSPGGEQVGECASTSEARIKEAPTAKESSINLEIEVQVAMQQECQICDKREGGQQEDAMGITKMGSLFNGPTISRSLVPPSYHPQGVGDAWP